MRPRLPSLPASLFLVALAACSRHDGEGGPPRDELHEGSKEKPQAVSPSPFRAPPEYGYLIADYRKKWTNLSGYEHSGLHWGQFISIYVNKEPDRYVENFLEYVRVYLNEDQDADEEEKAGDADSSKHFKPYSPGTIFLKEHYLPAEGRPGKPLTVALMIKHDKGYDSATGDWEFAQFSTEGAILFSGNSANPATLQMCIKCHQNMAERDYVFSTFCSLVPVKK